MIGMLYLPWKMGQRGCSDSWSVLEVSRSDYSSNACTTLKFDPKEPVRMRVDDAVNTKRALPGYRYESTDENFDSTWLEVNNSTQSGQRAMWQDPHRS